jgi:hypothetical protein
MNATTDWRSSSEPAAPDDVATFSFEQQRCLSGLFSNNYSIDKNVDGAFTISDLWSVLKDILTVPADLIRAWSYGTDFGNFFEVTCTETSGSSFFLSAMVVIALVYSQAERLLVRLKSKQRLDTERWWKKERREKGYESSESKKDNE